MSHNTTETNHRYTGNGDTQEDQILHRLIRANGGWVPAPEFAKIALQYSRCIFGLRKDGWNVENRVEWAGKVRHGFFRLVPEQAPVESADAPSRHEDRAPVAKPAEAPSLFPDPQPVRYIPGGGH